MLKKELYMRSKILERGIESCRGISPGQMETLLSLSMEYDLYERGGSEQGGRWEIKPSITDKPIRPVTEKRKPPEGCEHEYVVIEHNLEFKKIRADNTTLGTKVYGCVIFHCKQCLDIQKKVIT